MPKFVLWRRGLRGPTIAVVTSKQLDEYDRHNKVSDPVEMKPHHEDLTLKTLTDLYSPPNPETSS